MSQETLRDSIVFLDTAEPDATLPHSKAYATVGFASWSQISSNAASLQSLADGSIIHNNSKNAFGLSAKEFEKTKQINKKMKTARLIQFLKNNEPNMEEDPTGALKGYSLNRGKDVNKARLSLSNLDHKNIKHKRNQDKGSTGTKILADKEGANPKKLKKVSLGTQFRRKSCHCSECGGTSQLELKMQNIVKAPMKDLQTVRNIRQKKKQKETDKQNMFLNLPNLNALVLSQKEKKEDSKVRFISQTPTTKRNDYRSLTDAKFTSALKNFNIKDSRRGSHTPLRRSRKDSLEDQVVTLPKQVFPSHYIIKIFTSDDTEKQLMENRNEALKKEEEGKKNMITAPVLAKKLPKPKRKRRDSALYREEPMSPYHSENERSSPRTLTNIHHAHNTTTSRPKMIVKKYVMKERADDIPDEIVITGNQNLEALDKETKKQMWGKIGLFSPKFKAIFGDVVEEEKAEEMKELGEEGNLTVEIKQEVVKTTTSRDFVKKIYSLPKQLPKLKILPNKGPIQTNRIDNFGGPNLNRTPSHPIVNPLQLDKIYQTSSPNYMDSAVSARTKTEPMQELVSIYASPKTARIYAKAAFNFPQMPNLKESLPSISQNTNIFSPRGHRPTQSLGGSQGPIASPRQKYVDMKMTARRGKDVKTDLRKVVANISNFSLGSSKLNHALSNKKCSGV